MKPNLLWSIALATRLSLHTSKSGFEKVILEIAINQIAKN